jgi:Fe-S cluster biosynthesis and repair protein YggX
MQFVNRNFTSENESGEVRAWIVPRPHPKFHLHDKTSRQPPVKPRRLCDNLGRKFMSDHKVFCAKLKQELPGLPEPPFDSDLGKKIYENVSQQAWGQWMEHCKMLLNEYRLNPARKQDQEVIVKQMEQFFFGEGSARPAEYVPPTH